MSRHAVKISIVEFKEKLIAAGKKYYEINKDEDGYHIWEGISGWALRHLNSKVSKDLSKIEFDSENIDTEYRGPSGNESIDFMGLHELDNGLVFLGIYSGGDWEYPIFFIIYWDGETFRGYIPTDGQYYNRKTKQAFGNDEESDAEQGYDCESSDRHDFGKMLEDIKKRIVVKA